MSRRKHKFYHNWKIYNKYLLWRFHRKIESGEIVEKLLEVIRKGAFTAPPESESIFYLDAKSTAKTLLNVQPMSTPDSPIFVLKKETKNGTKNNKINQLG